MDNAMLLEISPGIAKTGMESVKYLQSDKPTINASMSLEYWRANPMVADDLRANESTTLVEDPMERFNGLWKVHSKLGKTLAHVLLLSRLNLLDLWDSILALANGEPSMTHADAKVQYHIATLTIAKAPPTAS